MIFIAGPHNAGKTTLAEWLEKFGFSFLDTGNVVRGIHAQLAPEGNFFAWATEVSERDPDFFNKCVLETITERMKTLQGIQDIIVVGNRQIQGIDFIRRNIHQENLPQTIIYLDATEEELFKRHFLRQDGRLPTITRAEFSRYLDYDNEMGLKDIKEVADLILGENQELNEVRESVAEHLSMHGYDIDNENNENYECGRRPH